MLANPEDIARDLLAQHERGERFTSIRDRVTSRDDAYAVQDVLVPLLEKSLGTYVAGHKIALSSKQTQEWLNIHEPCGGQILANRIHQSQYKTKMSDWVNLGIETEICLVPD
ncbi:MAG: hypothetical protein RLN70_12020, partial [Rhodospirillaceae bacterium]